MRIQVFFGQAKAFMFEGGVGSFFYLVWLAWAILGNWIIPTKKGKRIGYWTEISSFHLKFLFFLWWGEGNPIKSFFFFLSLNSIRNSVIFNAYLKSILSFLEPHFWGSLSVTQGVNWLSLVFKLQINNLKFHFAENVHFN